MRHLRGAAGARFRADYRGCDRRDFSRGHFAGRSISAHRGAAGESALNVSVGLIQGRTAVEVELTGTFTDTHGKPFTQGRYRFTSDITLAPSEPAFCSFALDDV